LPPTSTLFPYTTLFRSIFRSVNLLAQPLVHVEDLNIRPIVTDNYQDGIFNVDLQLHGEKTGNVNVRVIDNDGNTLVNETHPVDRSEEHTSELQSRFDLV